MAEPVLKLDGWAMPVVAIVFSADGSVHDYAFTWETGQSYAQEGYRVIAVADDGPWRTADAQRLYDSELARYNDDRGVQLPESTTEESK